MILTSLCAFGFLTVFNFMHVINFCSAAVRQICISYFESETGIKDGISTFYACSLCLYLCSCVGIPTSLFIWTFVIHSTFILPGR